MLGVGTRWREIQQERGRGSAGQQTGKVTCKPGTRAKLVAISGRGLHAERTADAQAQGGCM